jgi:hypothetical protein
MSTYRRLATLIITIAEMASLSAVAQEPSSVSSYPDGRPSAMYRCDAKDSGRIFRHGAGPANCDRLGAREASVVFHNGVYHLFYDGAEPNAGWLACLATSPDLKNWRRHGKVFSFGKPGTLDSHTATSPWFIQHDDLWHAFYVGCRKTTSPPDCIPHMPYFTLKAEAEDLKGPWRKRYDVTVVTTAPGTYRADTASPGYLFWHEGKLWTFFSCAQEVERGGRKVHLRTLGMAHAPHPDGPWTVLDAPILPLEEQIENSSLYHEKMNGWWFLFTNHVGVNEHGHEWTDSIWVYWSKDPTTWEPTRKAVVLDGQNCSWSKQCVGMPSVVPVGERLALFYDAPGGDSMSHMGRDIGLAWLTLPLTPPTE